MEILLKFVPESPIKNIPALVQMMAWCRSGDKPLSEPMMVSLLTHACATRLQLDKSYTIIFHFINSQSRNHDTFLNVV